MATRTFALTVDVPTAPATVIDLLAAIDRHVGLHPYLRSARVTGEGRGPDGPWRDWAVLERPPLGPWTYPMPFTARITRSSPTTMCTDVTALLTRLRVETVATATDLGATVAEACTVTAPLPLVGYVVSAARRAHERTFAMLPGALGVRGDGGG